MNTRKSASKLPIGSNGTLKKISFKKGTIKVENSSNGTKAAESLSFKQEQHETGIGNAVCLRPTSSTRQQIKVKRKSLTASARYSKKRISTLECSANVPINNDNDLEFNDLKYGIASNPSDSLSDFWGDDQLFADFNMSDVICSSLENIPNKESNFSTPKCKKETIATNSEPNDKETFYGLPMNVKTMFSQYQGIEELYEWQKDCLCLPAITERRNLIYSLPTSGGKTLVSEILFLRELIVNKKDVIFVLPFVSIVQEKVKNLTQFAVDLDFVVEEYAASKGKFPPRKRRKKKTIYIATIEKANGLINSFIEESRTESLGLVVIDELHMIGEGGRRGAVLEMCLTKLIHTTDQIQIIGMSATLSNINDLQQFLKADVYINDFRPVKLHEYIKVDNKIYEVVDGEVSNEPVRCLPAQPNKKRNIRDPDNLVLLVTEVVPKYSCLVFCSTKRNCENVATLLTEFMSREMNQIKSKERKELLKALYNQANGVCPVLKRTIPYGVAYHHSGLTADERKLIEDSYSKGILCVLACTSTLAAGVNLPAKRVIVRAPYVGSNVISRSQYKQMIGRAGRAGIDTSGESILLLKDKDRGKVESIICGPCDSCKSSLVYESNKGVRQFILSLLGLKICTTKTQLVSAIECSLMSIQADSKDFTNDCVQSSIESLECLGHIKMKSKDSGDVTITKQGHATYKGCLDVDITPAIYNSIKKALECLVLVNELHLLYLVTPLDISLPCETNWMVYQKQVAVLNKDEKRVPSVIGICEMYLLGKAYGQRISKCNDEGAVHRFYMTLMLYKLVQGQSIWLVADLFEVPRGFLQNLLTSASSYASCLIHFTQELNEFWSIKLLLETIVQKLTYTASLELVPLLEISGVKQGRARQLFNAGYHSLCDVARAKPQTLVQEIEHLFISQAKQIVSAAKMLLQEKADALREEAEDLLS